MSSPACSCCCRQRLPWHVSMRRAGVKRLVAARRRRPTAFRVITMPSDGACLFHAIAHGLRELGIQEDGISLRKRISDFIRRMPEHSIAETPLKVWVEWESGETVGIYSAMLDAGILWGGAIEIAVAAHIYQVCIKVYQDISVDGFLPYVTDFRAGGMADSKADTMEQCEYRLGRTVRLLHSSQHYEALVRGRCTRAICRGSVSRLVRPVKTLHRRCGPDAVQRQLVEDVVMELASCNQYAGTQTDADKLGYVIKTISGHCHGVKLSAGVTISELQHELLKLEGVMPHQQQFVFTDASTREPHVHVLYAMRGGMSARFSSCGPYSEFRQMPARQQQDSVQEGGLMPTIGDVQQIPHFEMPTQVTGELSPSGPQWPSSSGQQLRKTAHGSSCSVASVLDDALEHLKNLKRTRMMRLETAEHERSVVDTIMDEVSASHGNAHPAFSRTLPDVPTPSTMQSARFVSSPVRPSQHQLEFDGSLRMAALIDANLNLAVPPMVPRLRLPPPEPAYKPYHEQRATTQIDQHIRSQNSSLAGTSCEQHRGFDMQKKQAGVAKHEVKDVSLLSNDSNSAGYVSDDVDPAKRLVEDDVLSAVKVDSSWATNQKNLSNALYSCSARASSISSFPSAAMGSTTEQSEVLDPLDDSVHDQAENAAHVRRRAEEMQLHLVMEMDAEFTRHVAKSEKMETLLREELSVSRAELIEAQSAQSEVVNSEWQCASCQGLVSAQEEAPSSQKGDLPSAQVERLETELSQSRAYHRAATDYQYREAQAARGEATAALERADVFESEAAQWQRMAARQREQLDLQAADAAQLQAELKREISDIRGELAETECSACEAEDQVGELMISLNCCRAQASVNETRAVEQLQFKLLQQEVLLEHNVASFATDEAEDHAQPAGLENRLHEVEQMLASALGEAYVCELDLVKHRCRSEELQTHWQSEITCLGEVEVAEAACCERQARAANEAKSSASKMWQELCECKTQSQTAELAWTSQLKEARCAFSAAVEQISLMETKSLICTESLHACQLELAAAQHEEARNTHSFDTEETAKQRIGYLIAELERHRELHESREAIWYKEFETVQRENCNARENIQQVQAQADDAEKLLWAEDARMQDIRLLSAELEQQKQLSEGVHVSWQEQVQCAQQAEGHIEDEAHQVQAAKKYIQQLCTEVQEQRTDLEQQEELRREAQARVREELQAVQEAKCHATDEACHLQCARHQLEQLRVELFDLQGIASHVDQLGPELEQHKLVLRHQEVEEDRDNYEIADTSWCKDVQPVLSATDHATGEKQQLQAAWQRIDALETDLQHQEELRQQVHVCFQEEVQAVQEAKELRDEITCIQQEWEEIDQQWEVAMAQQSVRFSSEWIEQKSQGGSGNAEISTAFSARLRETEEEWEVAMARQAERFRVELANAKRQHKTDAIENDIARNDRSHVTKSTLQVRISNATEHFQGNADESKVNEESHNLPALSLDRKRRDSEEYHTVSSASSESSTEDEDAERRASEIWYSHRRTQISQKFKHRSLSMSSAGSLISRESVASSAPISQVKTPRLPVVFSRSLTSGAESRSNSMASLQYTIVDPSCFHSPATSIQTSGGTAPFFNLTLLSPRSLELAPDCYVGKDVSRAADEITFYEDVLQLNCCHGRGELGSLLDFMFEYEGVLRTQIDDVQGTQRDLLVLHNLMSGCKSLRMLDIKIGQKTASARWQGKSTVGALAQGWLDASTNSISEGFRMEGFQQEPPVLTSLRQGGKVKASISERKGHRGLLQRMPATAMFMHLLDVHQVPPDPGVHALQTVLAPIELAERCLHEMVRRLTALAIACHCTPVPHKWVGSSVAVGFDIGVLPRRSATDEDIKSKVRVNIFDWGRSQLNTVEKHQLLSEAEKRDRFEFWAYYVSGIERLAWEAARAYWNRFSTTSWHEVIATVCCSSTAPSPEIVGRAVIPVKSTEAKERSVILNLSTGAVTASSGLWPAMITYMMEYRVLPESSRLHGTWRVSIIKVSNIKQQDCFVMLTAISECKEVCFQQQTEAITPSEGRKSTTSSMTVLKWGEVLDLPIARHSDLLRTALDDASSGLGQDQAFESMFLPEGVDEQGCINACLVDWVAWLDHVALLQSGEASASGLTPPASDDLRTSEAGMEKRWAVKLDRCPGQPLGLIFHSQTLIVEEISAQGLVSAWNMLYPSRSVFVGDKIMEVNGARHGAAIVEECSRNKVLRFEFCRKESANTPGIHAEPAARTTRLLSFLKDVDALADIQALVGERSRATTFTEGVGASSHGGHHAASVGQPDMR